MVPGLLLKQSQSQRMKAVASRQVRAGENPHRRFQVSAIIVRVAGAAVRIALFLEGQRRAYTVCL